MAQTVKRLSTMQETWVGSLGWEDSLEKEMATHSCTLAWRIPWTEEPGKLQSTGSLSWTRLSNFTFTFHFHALEKEMATHSSVLAWRIPGTEEPDGLQSIGSQSQTQLRWLSMHAYRKAFAPEDTKPGDAFSLPTACARTVSSAFPPPCPTCEYHY